MISELMVGTIVVLSTSWLLICFKNIIKSCLNSLKRRIINRSDDIVELTAYLDDLQFRLDEHIRETSKRKDNRR